MKIAVGNSRMDKKWKNKDITWEDFIARVGSTIRTTETVSEFRKMSRAQQDSIKDVGGFVEELSVKESAEMVMSSPAPFLHWIWIMPNQGFGSRLNHFMIFNAVSIPHINIHRKLQD